MFFVHDYVQSRFYEDALKTIAVVKIVFVGNYIRQTAVGIEEWVILKSKQKQAHDKTKAFWWRRGVLNV